MKKILHAFVLMGVIMSLLLAPLTVMGMPGAVDNTVDTEQLEQPVAYEDKPKEEPKKIASSKASIKNQLRKAWKVMPKSFEDAQRLQGSQDGAESFDAVLFTTSKKDALMLTATVVSISGVEYRFFTGNHYQKDVARNNKYVDTGNVAFGLWTDDLFTGWNAGSPFIGFHEDGSNKWFVTTPTGEKAWGTYIII